MKTLLILTASILYSTYSLSQQWVDEIYEVDTIQDTVYGSAIDFNNSQVDLHVDIYSPKCQDNTSRRPLLMVVHGGGFIGGSYKDAGVQQICAQFARRGYIAVSVQYRLGYINDEGLHNCNLVNGFQCGFATDTMEWYRAYYRGIQDVKGATRFMINRKDDFHIDEQNVFLMGESAGAFLAMGATYMDDPSERPLPTFAISDAPEPNQNTQNTACSHNIGQTFSGAISRPDLGGIDGNIEPALYPFTIRGVGNIFGGMFQDLLSIDNATTKPALYSFHQACDIIVPWDSKKVYYGLSWCYANCNGCTQVYNTPIVHGSKTIDEWNTNLGLGYDIQSEFLTNPFPNACGVFPQVPQSCADQINNPCHAYDNKQLRLANMATFFASKMVSPEICAPYNSLASLHSEGVKIYPNPVKDVLHITSEQEVESLRVLTPSGKVLYEFSNVGTDFQCDLSKLSSGVYLIEFEGGNTGRRKIIIRK